MTVPIKHEDLEQANLVSVPCVSLCAKHQNKVCKAKAAQCRTAGNPKLLCRRLIRNVGLSLRNLALVRQNLSLLKDHELFKASTTPRSHPVVVIILAHILSDSAKRQTLHTRIAMRVLFGHRHPDVDS